MQPVLVPALMLAMVALAGARADAPNPNIAQEGRVIQFRRGIGMTFVCKAGNIQIRADEADVYPDSNQALLSGNVQVNLPKGAVEQLTGLEGPTP